MQVSASALAAEAIGALAGPVPEGAAEIERVRDESPGTPTVVVVGETKRGKSSLVNALLNTPGLSPVGAAEATSSYLRIGYAPEPAARMLLPGVPGMVDVSLDLLAEHVTVGGSAACERGHPTPRMVEIDCPAPLLRNLALVDTPGVGGLDSAHGEIALHAARSATALLFVVDASAPLTASELDFLRQASETVDLVLFAVTKTDTYRGWRQIVHDDRALLREHAPRFAGADMLAVSPRLFEQARSVPAGELAAVLRTESQISGLQIALQTKVAARATALHQANVLRAARTQLAGYYRSLGVARAAVDPDPDRVQALRAERDKLLRSRRSDSRGWQLRMRAEMARARMDSMHDVQRELREGLHFWRTEVDQADTERLRAVPAELDASLHAASLRVFDRLLDRLRAVTESVLADMFAPEELAEVHAGIARAQLPDPITPPDARAPTVEDKIVLFGGMATGMAASRMVAFLPAMVGMGAATVVLAPISIGLGLAATAWMIRSRRHLAEKNHLKLWLSETMTEARAALESEVGSQFIDAEHSLTLALDAAIQRRIAALDSEISNIDTALKLDGQEKERRRRDLAAAQQSVRQLVGRIDQVLPILRSASPPGGVGVVSPARVGEGTPAPATPAATAAVRIGGRPDGT